MENTTLTHLAIIMDGNRRWAKEKGLEPNQGHRQGVEALERIVRASSKMGIPYLTVYALSSENLTSRARDEISGLFNLIKEGFVEKLPVLKEENVQVNFLGNLEKLPWAVKQTIASVKKSLAGSSGLKLSIAINYGSREEIANAAKSFSSGSQEDFSKFLYTKDLPDPDLIIRTGGEKRLSNFLLWQAAYSELYFTNVLWPDFNEVELKKALADFESRKRNFGH